MRSIPFRAVYREPILEGTKTATLRKGRVGVEPGERVALTCGRRPFAEAVVERVSYLTLGGVDEHDAALDGFDGVHEFIGRVLTTYPALTSASPVTIIRFRVDQEAS